MSGENMKDVYAAAAGKAFERCMTAMSDVLPEFGNNTGEFVMANAYVAGGILSSCLVFADTPQDKQALKMHLLSAMESVLENTIQTLTPPDGPGN